MGDRKKINMPDMNRLRARIANHHSILTKLCGNIHSLLILVKCLDRNMFVCTYMSVNDFACIQIAKISIFHS